MKKIFLEKLQKIYSQEDFEICKSAFEMEKRKVSFRINTLKSNPEEIEKVLTKNNLKFKKVNCLENAYLLENAREKDLWDLDIFTKGKIYMQSLSSQMPVNISGIKNFSKVLDITAAPGGKTSALAAKMENTGEIIAIDNNAIRIDKLNFTLKRQGVTNTKVIKADARTIQTIDLEEKGETQNLQNYFDFIIADLPCSAEGKFNFHREKSYGYWNEITPKKNAKLQKSILKNSVSLLKENGTLIYSTCTISPEENEDIVHFLLCNFPELELEKIDLNYKYTRPGVKTFEKKHFKKEISEKVLRILPSEETEGFFIAKFKKVM